MMNEKKIGEVFRVTSGGTPSRKKNEYFLNGTIPWVKTGDLKNKFVVDPKEFITELALANSSAKIFPKNTVLLAMYGATIGACSILKIEAATNQACGAILPSDECEPVYLYYYLKSIKEDLISKGVGGAQPNISGGIIKNTKIPLPPLAQQKKIAAILDAADAYRQKTRALLGKYEELTQGLFLEMFGDPVRNEKGWEKVPTITYCDCIVPGRDKPKSFSGETPWITTSDLNHLGITYRSKKEIGLSEEEIKLVRARIIPKESVIMTCVGDLGVISINEYDMVMNQQLHAFICHRELNNIFLMYNLSYQTPYMVKMASSTTVPYMNKTVANNTPTIVPPIALQNKFANRIQAVEAQKAEVRKALAQAEDLFNSLLQRAFKGELG